jgi:hypothetical protein
MRERADWHDAPVARAQGASGEYPAVAIQGRAVCIDSTQESTTGGDIVNAKEALMTLMSIDGIIGACIVDSNSGMMLGSAGGSATFNLELAAAGNTEVVRAKRNTMKALRLNDPIEDVLMTLGRQYHLLRPLRTNDALFIYIALDRGRANLALARHRLTEVERDLEV